MPWQKVIPINEINRFVILAKSGRFSGMDLCEHFGMSRNTGHKHLECFEALALAGIKPRGSRLKVFHTFHDTSDFNAGEGFGPGNVVRRDGFIWLRDNSIFGEDFHIDAYDFELENC